MSCVQNYDSKDVYLFILFLWSFFKENYVYFVFEKAFVWMGCPLSSCLILKQHGHEARDGRLVSLLLRSLFYFWKWIKTPEKV